MINPSHKSFSLSLTLLRGFYSQEKSSIFEESNRKATTLSNPSPPDVHSPVGHNPTCRTPHIFYGPELSEAQRIEAHIVLCTSGDAYSPKPLAHPGLGHPLNPRGLNPTSRGIFHSLANCRAMAKWVRFIPLNLPTYIPTLDGENIKSGTHGLSFNLNPIQNPSNPALGGSRNG